MSDNEDQNSAVEGRSDLEGFVMRDGCLPAFDGRPVLASCENCAHCIDQSDGPEYGPAWYGCEKPGRGSASELICLLCDETKEIAASGKRKL